MPKQKVASTAVVIGSDGQASIIGLGEKVPLSGQAGRLLLDAITKPRSGRRKPIR